MIQQYQFHLVRLSSQAVGQDLYYMHHASSSLFFFVYLLYFLCYIYTVLQGATTIIIFPLISHLFTGHCILS